MQKIYRDELLLRTCHCDMQGRWRPSAILEAMQEAAGTHAELLGCGRNRLLSDNIVWVISRIELHMDRYPSIGERVAVETFPMPCRRCLFPRYFVFRDAEGNTLGSAGTLWVLLDLTTRRMTAPQSVAERIPNNADLVPPLPLPHTVPRTDGTVETLLRTAAYSDLDVNAHVNNARYADWLSDALGTAVMRQYCLRTLYINYAAEVLPDAEIEMQLIQNGLSYHLTGSRDGRRHFEIGGELMERT